MVDERGGERERGRRERRWRREKVKSERKNEWLETTEGNVKRGIINDAER